MAERDPQGWMAHQQVACDDGSRGQSDFIRKRQNRIQHGRSDQPLGTGRSNRMHEHRHVETLGRGEEGLELGRANGSPVDVAADFDARHVKAVAGMFELRNCQSHILQRYCRQG